MKPRRRPWPRVKETITIDSVRWIVTEHAHASGDVVLERVGSLHRVVWSTHRRVLTEHRPR